jgi:hypothetical protein
MHASSDVLTTLPLTCITLKTFYLLLIDVMSLNYTINFPQCECTSFSKYIRQNTFWTMTVAQVVKKTLCFIKPKAHCRFLKSLPLDLNLSQNKLADKITHSYCFTINSDKVIQSTARYTEWSLASTVHEQQPVCFSSLRSEWHSLPTSTSFTYLLNNNFVKSTNY